MEREREIERERDGFLRERKALDFQSIAKGVFFPQGMAILSRIQPILNSISRKTSGSSKMTALVGIFFAFHVCLVV